MLLMTVLCSHRTKMSEWYGSGRQSYELPLNKPTLTVASFIQKLSHHVSITMARKMEISWHPINLEPALHPATFARFKILLHSPLLLSPVVGLDEEIT